jgi:hypothetical protein
MYMVARSTLEHMHACGLSKCMHAERMEVQRVAV